MTREITVGSVTIGGGRPFALIAGPCVIESREHALRHAEAIAGVCRGRGIGLVFKSSYDKANRTSGRSFRGLGQEDGLRILAEDATKVRVSDSRITAIGKDVYPYDAVDTGCFRLEPLVFDALAEVARQEPPSVTLGMRWLLARDRFAAVPLTGVRWTDVDTPEDYAKAEMLLSAQLRRRSARQTTVAA